MQARDVELIAAISSRETYEKYGQVIKDDVLLPETVKLKQDMGRWFEAHSDKNEIDWIAFDKWVGLVARPNIKHEDIVFRQQIVAKLPAAPDPKIIEHFVKLRYALKIIDTCELLVAAGKEPSPFPDSVEKIVQSYRSETATTIAQDAPQIVEIAELLPKVNLSGGLEWRLEDLNIGIGPLRPGDFIVVGGRPEIGKTSFVISETTHMCAELRRQAQGSIVAGTGAGVLWLNNEEVGTKILLRCLQASVGVSFQQIATRQTLQAEYDKLIGRNGILLREAHGKSLAWMEREIINAKPSIVVLNVLDPSKIEIGKRSPNEAETYKIISGWCRRVATAHNCAVLAVAQADASAEGEKYVYQHQLYGSKTGLQQEADCIITLGAEDPTKTDRFIHLPKNKLIGGPRSQEQRRHGFFEVAVDWDKVRFRSKFYKRP